MNQSLVEEIMGSGKFPHVFTRRRLIETHISFVILGTTFAYKFKKEIRYSFLDFSTLQKRKYFCERELMLNNRLTRGVYIKVVTVCRKRNEIIIDGVGGEIIDYAIQMKRLQDAKQMHRMLVKKQVTDKHMHALAVLIRNFHHKTAIVTRSYDQSHFSERFNDIISVVSIIRRSLGDKHVQRIETSVRLSDQFLEHNGTLFSDRVEKGWIRDCHGDLHARNIFLYAHPVIFDCIEFNDEFRQIDVLDEIAFFCMDLEAEGFLRLSQAFQDYYFSGAMDEFGYGEQKLFTYYKAYRANVRAKVNALRAKTSTGDELEKNLRDVRKYLVLMENYLLKL